MDPSQSSFVCELCLHGMVEPRALPCGHTFCRNCLQQRIGLDHNIKCSKDENWFNVPGGTAYNLSRNYPLESMIEKLLSSRKSVVKIPCTEHADNQADIFCESCMETICAVCIKQHKLHEINAYSESSQKCALRIQKLKSDVKKLQEAVDNEMITLLSEVEAQVEACKRKVGAAYTKIRDIVRILKEVGENLKDKATNCGNIVKEALSFPNLESLKQKVDKLSSAALSVGDLGTLNTQFKTTGELMQKLEVYQKELVKESVPDVPRRFYNDQLTRKLENIIEYATELKQNVIMDTTGYLSLQKLKDDLLNPQHKQLLIIAGGFENEKALACDTSSNTWTTVQPLSCKRYGTAATLWNGKMIVAGGWNEDDEEKCLNTVEQFDPEINCWTALPPMNHRRQWLGLVTFDNALIAIGGYDGKIRHKSVERYNTNTNKWDNLKHVSHLKVARSGVCCAVLGVGILVAGGFTGKAYSDTCELLKGIKPECKSVSSLITARNLAAAATLNDKVYVFGGWNKKNEWGSVEQYDAEADKWTLLPVELSQPRHALAAATVNDRVYVCGGAVGLYKSVNTVDCFDASVPQINQVKPLPIDFRGAAALCLPVPHQIWSQLFQVNNR